MPGLTVPHAEASVDCDPASAPTNPARQRYYGLGVLIFVVSLASFIQAASQRSHLNAPPVNGGDEDDYERLGYNLAAGLGFGYCPSDAPILAGQSEPSSGPVCEAGCESSEFTPTAYRPPGFPFLIAAVYSFSPLNYFVIRLINCIFCALAVSIVSVTFARHVSVISGVAVGTLCSLDPRFREFAGTFLTENMATLTFCLFAVTWTAFLRRPTLTAACLSGIAFSALVFTRSFFVAWYPVIWLIVAGRSMTGLTKGASPFLHRLRTAICFCCASVLLTGPWWIRNCLILDAMMPTGTQGGIGIADGFSDSAYTNYGSWTPTTAYQIADEMRQDPALQSISKIEFEKEHCRRGAQHASEWMRQHPDLLLRLSWWKLSRLWECGSVMHGTLFGICFLGMWFARRETMTHVLFLLLLLNSITVMATYHTYERFLTPFRPLIHGMVGYGLQRTAEVVWRQLRSLR